MEKEEDTTSRLEEAREARVFPLFRLSMDFFASPSVYTPGAFLPSISAVFFPIFFFRLLFPPFFSPSRRLFLDSKQLSSSIFCS